MIQNGNALPSHRKRRIGRIRVEMSEIAGLTSSPNPVAFVVLIHDEPGGGRHFDVMIEQGESLATWRCPVAPEPARAQALILERLPNHRRHYLTYEGPISGNRGSVTRHDEGTCRVTQRDEGTWVIDWSGRWLNGPSLLRATGDAAQSWSLEFLEK